MESCSRRRILFTIVNRPLISVLIGMCLLLFTCRGGESQPETAVVILIDLSKSFAPLKSADERALEQVGIAVVHMATREWQRPVLFLWSIIGSSSQFRDLPCGPPILYAPRIGRQSRQGEIGTEQRLRNWNKACVLRLTGGGIKPEEYTDISGAVYLASETARSSTGRKFLIIMSDFYEDLPPGNQPTKFQLSGEQVVMLYRPDPRDEKDPNQMIARLQDWASRLKNAGARGACLLPVKGVSRLGVENCLRG
jgi:hypothetical protein